MPTCRILVVGLLQVVGLGVMEDLVEKVDVARGEFEGLNLAELVRGQCGDDLPQGGEGFVEALGALALPHVREDPLVLQLLGGGVRVSASQFTSGDVPLLGPLPFPVVLWPRVLRGVVPREHVREAAGQQVLGVVEAVVRRRPAEVHEVDFLLDHGLLARVGAGGYVSERPGHFTSQVDTLD